MQPSLKVAIGIITLVVGAYLGYMTDSKDQFAPPKVPNVLNPPPVTPRPANSGASGPNVNVDR